MSSEWSIIDYPTPKFAHGTTDVYRIFVRDYKGLVKDLFHYTPNNKYTIVN